MARKWIRDGIYKKKADAQKAAKRGKAQGGSYRVTKASKADYTKGKGYKVSRLWVNGRPYRKK
tara:strand:+ start:385 stop:573 length:189 start_codon:yes stop_codon:yes gene_type:complete